MLTVGWNQACGVESIFYAYPLPLQMRLYYTVASIWEETSNLLLRWKILLPLLWLLYSLD